MKKRYGDFRDLIVYRKAFKLAMLVFHISKKFPVEEKYALTDQLRRSSRSVCANIAEGYRKRQYPKHFTAKISDADMENSESIVWLDFALACKYIEKEERDKFTPLIEEIGKLLNHIIRNPEKYRH